ncbi:hypothetical protein [Allorhodopirellula heiligendammensis]|uniref:Uncharacterized protein n=1 Tax=Allorhodopirellula heiligendammensis TaxID=2714739 RepID=A0A5C6B0L2_9BACT|nr:hypothetical protein [Allorhodopirellula heiligendammensis]TWU05438.1 hypothetical protein Poly21_56450 [Allorhodopirellula heiligendammensis]
MRQTFFSTLILATVAMLTLSAPASAQFTPSGQANQVAPEKDRSGPFTPSEKYREVVKVDTKHYDVKPCALPNPTNGPSELYVYENAAGYFKIADMTSINSGKAKYTWRDGSKHEDELTYIAHGYIEEMEGYLVPVGTKVSVWAYRAQDAKGNHMFFYFGTEDIINAPQGRRYPLYYGFGVPGTADPTYRFVTQTGTKRK